MRKLLYRIFLGANILFALSLILSYLSVHINPSVCAFPALFGLAYPYLLFINVVFAFIWAVIIKWEALISIAVIAGGITHFSNYIKLSKPSGDKTGTFEVQSYNVRLFNYFEGKKNSNSEKRILDLLKNSQADIICLQEIYIIGDPGAKEREIKAALGGKYFSHFKVIPTGKNRFYGIATLSRFPMAYRGDIVHEKSSSLSIYTDLVRGNDTIRLFNNHLQSFHLNRMEKTFLAELTAGSDNKETLYEIRSISASLRQGFARRADQAQNVKERINRSPYPVIVAGDFNDVPYSYTYAKIRGDLKDIFQEKGFGFDYTFNESFFRFRIDQVFYDPRIELTAFKMENDQHGSDHFPLYCKFNY